MGKELVELQGTYRINEVVRQYLGELWRENSRVRKFASDPGTGPAAFGPNTTSFWSSYRREEVGYINRMMILGNRQRDGSSFTSNYLDLDERFVAVRLRVTAEGDDRVGNAYFQMTGVLVTWGSLRARHIIRNREPNNTFRSIMQDMWQGSSNPDGNLRNPGWSSTVVEVDWCFVNEGTLYANMVWPEDQDTPNTPALEPMQLWAKVSVAPLAVSVGANVTLRTGSRDLIILRVPWQEEVFQYTRVLFRDIVYDIRHFTERPYREIEMVLSAD